MTTRTAAEAHRRAARQRAASRAPTIVGPTLVRVARSRKCPTCSASSVANPATRPCVRERACGCMLCGRCCARMARAGGRTQSFFFSPRHRVRLCVCVRARAQRARSTRCRHLQCLLTCFKTRACHAPAPTRPPCCPHTLLAVPWEQGGRRVRTARAGRTEGILTCRSLAFTRWPRSCACAAYVFVFASASCLLPHHCARTAHDVGRRLPAADTAAGRVVE